MSGSNFCNRAYLSHNLVIANIEGDGNCFYRSVSHQLYNNQHRHHELRELTHKHMQTKASEYIGSFFLNEKSFLQYLERVKTDGEWAKEVEIINLAEALGVYIFVHTDSGKLYTYPEVDINVEKKVIHIWYDEGEHYCSIKSNNGSLDNFNPTLVPNYRGWKELNTQDRNKLSLIYHLTELKSLEDIMDSLRKFDDSLVKTLDYLGNPRPQKGNGKEKGSVNGKGKGGKDKKKGGKKNKARI